MYILVLNTHSYIYIQHMKSNYSITEIKWLLPLTIMQNNKHYVITLSNDPCKPSITQNFSFYFTGPKTHCQKLLKFIITRNISQYAQNLSRQTRGNLKKDGDPRQFRRIFTSTERNCLKESFKTVSGRQSKG